MEIINPATEEIIKNLLEDNEDTIIDKYNLLRDAQPSWSETPIEERIKILKKFSDLIKENIESLASVLTSEVGKPLQQSRNEINGAAARVVWLTENSLKYLSEEVMTQSEGLTEKIVYEPLGVICNISAWNYPYNVGVNVFVPALIAGNTVLYKPSEYSTLTGLEIEKYLKQAGVPDHVFQVAVGKGEVGEILLDMPFDGYFFTGSYKTGKLIYEKVAPKMVPCGLELGGKDPLYITDEILDVKSVAAGTADGAFYNNGQSCCAVERIYVHEKVYDEYVKEFVEEVKSWKKGKPADEGVYITVLTRSEQVNVIDSQVEDALAKGANVLVGGKRMEGTLFGYEPTVLVDVTHDMDIMVEETFGPVIGIMKVKDDQEAVELMQDTEYGLTAGVYSKTFERAQKILSKINTGTGYWNCCDRVSPALPWSGRNHSGFGSTLSHAGIRAFTKPKAYHLRG